MNEVATKPVSSSTNSPQRPLVERPFSTPLIVVSAALLLFAAAMSRSFYDGRMASPITHDDVNYFIIGIQRITFLRAHGFYDFLDTFIHRTEHAPFLTYQATLAYLLFGITDWAPYASNVALLIVFLGVAAHLMRDCPPAVIAAGMISLIALPMSSNLVIEFSPEVVSSLFTAIGAVLTLRLPLFGAPLGARFRAGLCFGLGFFAHPVASPFTLIAVLGTVGLVFLRETILERRYNLLGRAIGQSSFTLLLSLWLPLLYVAPSYNIYFEYFDRNILNPATRWRWEDQGATLLQRADFYISGPGGQFMFGNDRIWECGLIILIGLTAAWYRKDRPSFKRQAELCLLAVLFWLVPTLAPVQNGEYASCFGFALAFLTILGLRSISKSLPNSIGAVVLWLCAAALLVSDVSHMPVPNTPRTVTDREFAFAVQRRLSAVLFGNATEYHGTNVYMTNVGAFAPNILQYYMLKVDPSLDWNFDSGIMEPDPQKQISSINQAHEQFVVAGHHDNGFTYSPWAQPAEESVLNMLSNDPDYIPIDRFYGPNGRTVTVFQRRGNFVGWHTISGMSNPSEEPDAARVSNGGVAYLQSYAPRAISAQLQLQYTGAPGTKLDVLINQHQVAELTFAADQRASTLDQQINLAQGENDIALQYTSTTGSLTISKLLIIPEILPEQRFGNQSEIEIVAATYGMNCKSFPEHDPYRNTVARGNVTSQARATCDMATRCTLHVEIPPAGDPANGCGKDFSVEYRCTGSENVKSASVPGEALGKTLELECGDRFRPANAGGQP